MTIKVDCCENCPFHFYERDVALELCTFMGDEYILKSIRNIPDFCPLKDESVEIQLDIS